MSIPRRPKRPPPDFFHEDDFLGGSSGSIAGVDEAGRGPLAGSVVAAAVVLDRSRLPKGLDDSKKLRESARSMLFEAIIETADVGVGIVDHACIDRMNIRQATLAAMRMAARRLRCVPSGLLIDGNDAPSDLPAPARPLVSGDALSLSIAAASIIAKVTRDRMMVEFAAIYPGYGFDVHMGYPTKAHAEALARLGPSPIHRMSFGPLKTLAAA